MSDLTQWLQENNSACVPLPALTAGVDEVGRGALFGPVVAAAVILTPEGERTLQAVGVDDSKALSHQRREELAKHVREVSLTWGLGWAHPREIDRINILQATFLAMHRALSRLVPVPEHCLVDGNKSIPSVRLPQTTVVKGDSYSLAIASASILAKVHRDRWIVSLANRYPGYALASNKGYGSAAHRQALQELGPTHDHRLSFAPCQPQLIRTDD
ncbi:MAG: ribonuclease HII [Cyanobacteria bacterium P01_E01_bin.34]